MSEKIKAFKQQATHWTGNGVYPPLLLVASSSPYLVHTHTHTHWGQRWRKAHAAGSSTGVSYSGINFHFIEHGFIRIKKILLYGTSSVFTSNTYSSASTWVSRTQQYPDGLSWPPSLWIHREERKKENVSVVYFFKLNIVFMMLDVDGTPPELPSSS